MFVVGFDGYLKRVNPAFQTCFGWTDEQCLAQPLIERVHDDDVHAFLEAVNQLVAGHHVRELENRLQCADGTYRCLSWNAVPFLEQCVIYAMARDVTVAKVLADGLRSAAHDTQQLLCSIGESTADGIAVWDRDYRCLYANRAAAEQLDSSPDKLVGRILSDALAHLPDVVRLWRSRADAVFAKGEPVRVREPLPVAGRMLPTESVLSPVRDAQGTVFAVCVVYRDLSEWERSERLFEATWEMMHAMSESAVDALVTIDEDQRVVHWNPAAERMFGFTRQEMLGREPHAWLCPAGDQDRARRGLAQFAAGGTGPLVGKVTEVEARRKDGSVFPAEIALSAMQVQGRWWASAIIRDTTQRKASELVERTRVANLLAAKKIREHLLPRCSPVIPGFDIAGATYAAEYAAGDYYDYLSMADQALGVVVGDVTGHGLGPALLATSTQRTLQLLAETHRDMPEILTRANELLLRDTSADRFVTMLLGRLEPESRTFSYVNAGHPTCFVLDRHGAVKARLESTALPLGVAEDATFDSGHVVHLATGDLIVLATDGVYEAAAEDREQFGIERLLAYLRSHEARPAGEIVADLYRHVCRFSQRESLEDDLTAVIIKVVA